MGMTPFQIFLRIEAPLALPVVAAGVRTSAVQIVATATLATFIGGGGYGDYIQSGIALLDKVELLAGAIPVALFAVLTELLLAGAQRLVTPMGLRVQQSLAEDVPASADSLAGTGAAMA
jgi:osmoprotectant transport system permease protein